MRIALIGSRDIQQFPTISYGGIETCVENLAWGLHANNQDFACIVPRREHREAYPFEIIESDVPPMPGPEEAVWPFANSLPGIVKQVRPDIIWSQSFWSAEALQGLDIPVICTFHDFVPDQIAKNRWFRFRDNAWYRFISRFQFGQWTDPAVGWQQKRSFCLHTGLSNEEFEFGDPRERQNYFLWVGGFSWGWHNKGLNVFVTLAVRNPDKDFVVYGTGDTGIEDELKKLSHRLPNFSFEGSLTRGVQHREAFKKAKLFLMPTRIPEPLGRTNLESMSKGTPVLGTANGALPELIENGTSGFITDDMEQMEALLEMPLNYQRCFEYSKRFHVDFEVGALLKKSEHILTGRSNDANQS
jgi:glycosyltransferase involved in cell wall biosynthesis